MAAPKSCLEPLTRRLTPLLIYVLLLFVPQYHIAITSDKREKLWFSTPTVGRLNYVLFTVCAWGYAVCCVVLLLCVLLVVE